MTDIKQLQENAAAALLKAFEEDPALKLIRTRPGMLTATKLVGIVFDAADIEPMVAGYERDLRSKRTQITKLERELDPPDVPGDVINLFDYWRLKLEHPKAQLTADRRRVLVARLREKVPPAKIMRAIDGVAAFPFVVRGERAAAGAPNQRHDDLQLICRSGANIDRFARLAPGEGGRSGSRAFVG